MEDPEAITSGVGAQTDYRLGAVEWSGSGIRDAGHGVRHAVLYSEQTLEQNMWFISLAIY